MARLVTCASIAAAAFAIFCTTAHAATFEQYCDVQGFPASSRQTIVVLDEKQIAPEVGDQNNTRNAGWRQFVGRLLDFDAQAQIEQRFQPRERFTLAIARKDGSGLTTVFSGCVPFFSHAEESTAAKQAGYMNLVNKYFGVGPSASAKRDSTLFISRLGESIREAIQPDALSRREIPSGQIVSSGLVTSLKQSPFVNLSRGIPRIVLIANLVDYFPGGNTNPAKARSLGQSLGQQARLNLQGSELYLLGPSTNTSSVFQDAIEMFFLESHASLVSAGSLAGMPDFLSPPTKIRRYQGEIQFPDRKYPIRVRLVTDQNGTLINSWLAVEASKQEFLPLKGVLNCQPDSCTYSGDNVFAQIWNPDRNSKSNPTFDVNLPFGGARILEFTTQGDAIRGDISDPHIVYQNSQQANSKSNKLHFYATYSSGQF